MLLTKIIERDCKYNVIYLHKLNKDNVHLFIMYEQLCDQAGLRNWTDYVFSDYGEKSEQTHLWGDLGLDCKLRDGLLQQWFVQLRLLSALVPCTLSPTQSLDAQCGRADDQAELQNRQDNQHNTNAPHKDHRNVCGFHAYFLHGCLIWGGCTGLSVIPVAISFTHPPVASIGQVNTVENDGCDRKSNSTKVQNHTDDDLQHKTWVYMQ